MAVTVTVSNKFKYLSLLKVIDFANDTFKVILMAPGFSFSRTAHGGYADVSAQELPTAGGYTAGGATLTGVAVTQNNTTNKGQVTWATVSITASADLNFCAAIIYDDTVTTPTADPIVECIDFGETLTIVAGSTGTISNLAFYGA